MIKKSAMYQRRLSKRNKKVLYLLFCVLAVVLIVLGIRIYQAIFPRSPAQIPKEAHDYSPELANVQAKSFYVYDMNEKKMLFAKNEHMELPLASVTKLMSGLIVMANLPATSSVTVSKTDIEKGEGTNGLYAGEKWDASDLLNFSLIMSSNTGIYALADALNAREANGSTTIDLMNEKAKQLGLANTVFFNESGLDLSTSTSGAYSSAYDVAMLMDAILRSYPTLVSKTVESAASFISESNLRHIAINTDTLVDKIPGLVASKTGFTDLAGGNLVIAFDAGLMHPVIIALLGSTEDGRFTDMEQLVHVTLEKLSE